MFNWISCFYFRLQIYVLFLQGEHVLLLIAALCPTMQFIQLRHVAHNLKLQYKGAPNGTPIQITVIQIHSWKLLVPHNPFAYLRIEASMYLLKQPTCMGMCTSCLWMHLCCSFLHISIILSLVWWQQRQVFVCLKRKK